LIVVMSVYMNEIDVLAELYEDIVRDLGPEILLLTAGELAWQPGPRANPIGVTVWHIARGMDFLVTRLMQQKGAEDEIWHRNAWRERTGYDPRGLGYGGWGVLTGYSWDEVLAIPRLGAAELMEYLEQSELALVEQLRTFTPETIHLPAQAMLGGKLTYFRWVKEFYKGICPYWQMWHQRADETAGF
jgi:hypothetical protein